MTADEIRRRHEINDRGTPHQGARMVAKAWVDPAFKARMLKDAKKAAIELGIEVTEAELMAIENTPDCPQPDRLHAVLVLSALAAGRAAGLVRQQGLSLARGA